MSASRLPRRRLWVVAATALALSPSCTVGPRYRPEPPAPPGTELRAVAIPDSTRAFFDSLAAARRRDSLLLEARPLPDRSLLRDTLAGAAWMDILHDSTLVMLVETAIRQNRDVQTAVARIREYRADVGVARGALLPNVAINSNNSVNRIAFGTLGLQYTAVGAVAAATWELDFWGRIRHNVAAANADADAQEAAERATVLTLVSDVATGYLQLVEYDQEQEIALRTLSSRQATLELARERFRQGVISELDVRQFEAQVAAPAVTLAQTERLRAQTEHNLNVLLGEVPVPVRRTRTLAQAVSALVVPDSISSSLLERRPDVRQAERAYAASVARVGAAEAARLPVVSLTGSYGVQAGNYGLLFKTNPQVYQLLAGISIPVFNNGALASQAVAAAARADQARAQYEQSALNALRDANDALVAVRATRDEAVAQATQAQALRQALDLAQVRYEAGLASYLDLLDAQRSLFSAELALSQAQLQQLTAAVQLYRAIGGTWMRSTER